MVAKNNKDVKKSVKGGNFGCCLFCADKFLVREMRHFVACNSQNNLFILGLNSLYQQYYVLY